MGKSKYPRWQPDKSAKPWRKAKQEDAVSSKKEAVVDYKKEFMKKLQSLTYSRNIYDVWNDFVTMSACAISNVLDKDNYEEREKLYLSIINKYKERERTEFPELLAFTALALEVNPEQDFLGSVFMEMDLGNKVNGQFFTPYHISQLMAEMVMTDVIAEVERKGYITLHDPCCGGGGMLIAGINVVKRHLEKAGLNFQNHLFITAQDIDSTVARMCYIQLSLLGVAGFVKIGNTLSDPITSKDDTKNYWYTPMYFSDVWRTRRMIDFLKHILEGDENG